MLFRSERTMEVTQHVNETTVRCIMLSASEGLGKGMTVNALAESIMQMCIRDSLLVITR